MSTRPPPPPPPPANPSLPLPPWTLKGGMYRVSGSEDPSLFTAHCYRNPSHVNSPPVFHRFRGPLERMRTPAAAIALQSRVDPGLARYHGREGDRVLCPAKVFPKTSKTIRAF